MYPVPGALPLGRKWGLEFKVKGLLLVNTEAQDRGRICEPQASCSLLPLLPDTWEGLSYVAKYPQGQHQPVEMSVKPQT